jgi:integrase
MATKLTDAKIEALRPDPSGKQLLIWDSETRGLGVLVSRVTKSFVVQHKLNDGRTRRVTIGPVALGVRAARVEAAQLIAGMRQGVDPTAERRRAAAKVELTLRDALNAYVGTKDEPAGNIKPATRDAYRSTIEKRFADWLDRPLREIDGDMVSRRYNEIARDATHRGRVVGGGENTGAASANFAMKVLSAVYRRAEIKARRKADPLPLCPVAVLSEDEAWREVPERENYVTGDQLPGFWRGIEALDNRTVADCLKMILFTGMRKGEACGLRWDEVDMATRTIKLRSIRTKAGRKLDLPMSDVTHGILVARRALVPAGVAWVFPASRGGGHLEEPRYELRKIAVATGINATVHDLRRTFVTHAEESEISLLALKAMINHALGGSVTEKYVRMTTERLRKPVQRVADRLKELCGIDATMPEGVERLRG